MIATIAAATLFVALIGWLAVSAARGRASRWLSGLAYRVRGKRLVRVHVERRLEAQEGIVGETDMTIEGILLGRWCGMYVLTRAGILDEDSAVSLLGDVEIPADRVIFLQKLGGGQ